MRIVILEDDHLQAETITQQLQKAFPDSTIDLISTEAEFHSSVDRIVKERPDVVILDVMVRWTDPSPDRPVMPKEVADNGHYRAGLRCQYLLAERDPTIPVILYTILEEQDLEKELSHLKGKVLHLPKSPNLEELTSAVVKVVAGRR
jgi:DNA-binding NarL/FixJ family response regulator